MNNTDARFWHPWLRLNRVWHVMLQTGWTQLGDVAAECDAAGREVVVRCPGLARWRRTLWIRGGPKSGHRRRVLRGMRHSRLVRERPRSPPSVEPRPSIV